MKINQLFAYENTAPRPGKKLRAFRGVTIHDTGNPSPTANARAHAELLRGAWKTVDTSWHYCVDDHSIWQSIPEDEVSWHAGDGAEGVGNNETISIETCINEGGDYTGTLSIAAWLAADILCRHGAETSAGRLFQHFDWSGKNCPRIIRQQGLWAGFLASVQGRLAAMRIPQGQYTIKAGDTFWSISMRYNIPLEDLMAVNKGVDPYQLHVGQKINLPSDEHKTYTIKAGDTFWNIAIRHGTSVAEVMAANPNVDPYQLQIGQEIRLPR